MQAPQHREEAGLVKHDASRLLHCWCTEGWGLLGMRCCCCCSSTCPYYSSAVVNRVGKFSAAVMTSACQCWSLQISLCVVLCLFLTLHHELFEDRL